MNLGKLGSPLPRERQQMPPRAYLHRVVPALPLGNTGWLPRAQDKGGAQKLTKRDEKLIKELLNRVLKSSKLIKEWWNSDYSRAY